MAAKKNKAKGETARKARPAAKTSAKASAKTTAKVAPKKAVARKSPARKK